MPVITLTGFQGEQPRIAPRLLPPAASQAAFNVRLTDGALTPIRAMTQAGIVSGAGIRTIYRHGTQWLGWTSGAVKATEGPVAQDRLYYTGDGAPKMRLSDGTIYPLAVPRPTAAPTLTLSGTATGTITVSRTYVYTFVTSLGEESEPCPAATAVNWTEGQTVTVSGIEAPPTGRAITTQRFYRTQTGRSGTFLYLIAERAASNANFIDAIPPDQFQEPLPSVTWNAPPDSLAGLVAMPNGMMAAFSGKDLYFCEPFRPHAWPEPYVLTTDVAIVALAAIGNTLVVMTEAQPYIVNGTHPASMQMLKTEINLPCINARGVADLGFAIVYPSHEGLVAVRGDGAAGIVSGNLFQRDEWLEFDPETIIGAQFGNFYAGFYAKLQDDGTEFAGAMIVDVSGQSATMSRQTLRVDAAWFDVKSGGTFVLPYGTTAIMRLDAPDAPPMSFSWKSKPFVHKEPINYGVILVEADDTVSQASQNRYKQALAQAKARNETRIASGRIGGALHSDRLARQRLAGDALERPARSAFSGDPGYDRAETIVIADGRVVATLRDTNRAVRLPSGFKAITWEVLAAGNIRVERISLATTMADLQQSPAG